MLISSIKIYYLSFIEPSSILIECLKTNLGFGSDHYSHLDYHDELDDLNTFEENIKCKPCNLIESQSGSVKIEHKKSLALLIQKKN